MIILELITLMVAAFFTGAAFYITIAEQPARLELDDKALLTQWKPAYKKGYAMNASLAMIASLLGLYIWWQNQDCLLYLIGALVIGFNWPFTLIAMMPINKKLIILDIASAGKEGRALIIKWGKLHAVRSTCGLVASLCFLYGLFQHLN